MDFGKAFTFQFDDKEWLSKFGIGALIVLASVFIIPLPIIMGYVVQTARNVRDGRKDPLPAWDDMGGYFSDGLKIFVAFLVYASPIILVSLCVGLIPLLFAGSEAEEVMAVAVSLISCFSVAFSVALALLGPGIFIQYMRTGTIGGALQIGEVVSLTRNHIGDVLLLIVASFAAQLILQIVTMVSVITICGPFILGLAGAVWSSTVSGHLYGQLWTKVDGGGGGKVDNLGFDDGWDPTI